MSIYLTEDVHRAILTAMKRHQRKGRRASRTAIKIGGEIVGHILPCTSEERPNGFLVRLKEPE